MEKVGFFTAFSFGSLPKTSWQSLLEVADNYFYLGGKKACLIKGRVQNGKEGVVLAESDSYYLVSALKVMSYFTIIIPLLALIVKAVLRGQNQFYVIDSRWIKLSENPSQEEGVISERNLNLAERQVRIIDPKAELENGIEIDSDLIKRIQELMPKIKTRAEHPGIEWLSLGSTRVFRLKEAHIEQASRLVFKVVIPQQGMSTWINHKWIRDEERIRNRFNNMVKAMEICLIHRLKLLAIPHAKMFEVQVNESTIIPVIAEERLNIQEIESDQEELYHNHREALGKAVRELGTFIAETGFNDVDWRNIPVVNEGVGFQGARRIGLIDFEHMGDAKSGVLGCMDNDSRGLVRCLFSEKQIDVVLNDAMRKGIVTQDEGAQIKARRLQEIRSYR